MNSVVDVRYQQLYDDVGTPTYGNYSDMEFASLRGMGYLGGLADMLAQAASSPPVVVTKRRVTNTGAVHTTDVGSVRVYV